MKRSTILPVLAVLAVAGAITAAVLLVGGGNSSNAPAPTDAAAGALAAGGAAEAPADSGTPGGGATVRPSATAAPTAPSAAQVEAAAGVARAIEELRALYGFAGALDSDAALALIEKRNAATDALVARLAGLGSAAVDPILSAYADATTGREKLMLIRALADNPSPEAAKGLATLLETEDTYSYRRALIEALGDSKAPGAAELLAETLASADDPRARIAAVKALGEGQVGTDALIARIDTDPDVNVRVAALGRLAEVAGDAAQPVLDRLAASGDTEPRVRAAAIQAIARSFPNGAIDLLGRLASDDHASVRSAVVTALERIKTADAITILKDIASNDAEAAVRTSAEKALARMTL